MALLNTRSACVATLALLCGVAVAAGQREYRFEVSLDARPVGTHSFVVAPQPDGALRVQSEASFDVKFLGFVAYRYRHQADERWVDGCLVQIDATTNDNGRAQDVRGRQRGSRFSLEPPLQTAAREGCVVSYAYWDRDLLLAQRELLNPQTGEFDAVSFERLGVESLQRDGVTVPAQRYRLRSAQLAIDLWYAEDGQWLQLESTASGNRRLRYRIGG